MASHNRVILLGNLTRDIELRHTPGGTAVTDMSIAVNDRRKNATGEWVDEVTYVDITLWGRTAEVAGEFLHKGSQIFVEGRLKLDSWEADGQKKYKLRVIGERIISERVIEEQDRALDKKAADEPDALPQTPGANCPPILNEGPTPVDPLPPTDKPLP